MTEEDRAYYSARYAYAVEKAAQDGDPGTKAAHLVMAAEYRRRAGLDDVAVTTSPTAADATTAAAR